MRKYEITAIIVCLVLTAIVFVGSTGLGYADYRPLRDYDIISISVSWLGLAFYLFQGRRAQSSK